MGNEPFTTTILFTILYHEINMYSLLSVKSKNQ